MGCGKSKEENDKDIDLSIKKDRSCTDILCCLIFLVFLVAFIAVGAIGIKTGDPYRLLYATDYLKQTCGEDGRGVNVYYPRLNQDIAAAIQNGQASKIATGDFSGVSLYGICVNTCPMQGDIVCNYGYKMTSTASTFSSTCSNPLLSSTLTDCSNCWSSALDASPTLYRCIWQEKTKSVATERCTNPSSPIDPTATGYIDPTSTSCISKEVITLTTVDKAAQSNPAEDDVATIAADISLAISSITAAKVQVIVSGFAASFVLGFVYLILLQWFGGCIVTFTLWAVVLGCFILTIFCFVKSGLLTTAVVAGAIASASTSVAGAVNVNTTSATNAALSALATASNSSVLTTAVSSTGSGNTTTWEIAAFVMLAVSIIVLCLVVAMSAKIRVAVGVLKEASAAIQDVPVVVFTPLLTLTLTVALFIWFCFTSAAIKTMGSFTLGVNITGTVGNSTIIAPNFASSTLVTPFLWFNLFGFLWVLNYIQGIGMMAVAGTIGDWYYTRPEAETGKKSVHNAACCSSLYRVFRYHLGSIAFGSFIIAVVQLIRCILAYIDHQTKGLQQSNIVIKIIMKVVQCCMWCFEKCIKFISFNAYVMVALRGTGFVSSTCTAVKLILGQILTVGVLNVVSGLMMILGKLLITAACMVICYVWLEYGPTVSGVSEILAPVIFVGCLAYAVARNFLTIYGMALDTIMLCYCEDVEKHAGHKEMVYSGAPLRKAMGIDGEVPRSPSKITETPKGNVVVPLNGAPILNAVPTNVIAVAPVTVDDDL